MSAFMGKLCKTITFLSSIKELREAALSYKEAFEPAVTKTTDLLRFNKSTKDKLCKSHYTVGKKKHINCSTEHLKLSSDVGGGFSLMSGRRKCLQPPY